MSGQDFSHIYPIISKKIFSRIKQFVIPKMSQNTLNTLNTLRAVINRPGFTTEERISLRKYFTENVEKRDDIVTFLSDCTTDEEKRGYLKSLISTPSMFHHCARCHIRLSSNLPKNTLTIFYSLAFISSFYGEYFKSFWSNGMFINVKYCNIDMLNSQ